MITVLTPTFNRAHTLPRLFESLQAQSMKSFEWLVIDDGSTDKTKKLVSRLAASHSVPTRYILQNNGGKHAALNTGAKHALGAWTLIVDSDDALTPDAIEMASKEIEALGDSNITGICFRKTYFDQSLIGKDRSADRPRLMHPTAAGRYFGGDLAYIFRTEKLRAHPFPVHEGEKFVPELYIWNQIGDEGPIWYLPQKAIYLCEYLPDGYTANFKTQLKKNPRGFGLYYRTQITRERSWLAKAKCSIRAMQCLFYSVTRR